MHCVQISKCLLIASLDAAALFAADGVHQEEVGVEGPLGEELLDERHHQPLVELGVDLAAVDNLLPEIGSYLVTPGPG